MDKTLAILRVFNLEKVPQRTLNTLLNDFSKNAAPIGVAFDEFLAENNIIYFEDVPHFVEPVTVNFKEAFVNDGKTIGALIDPSWTNVEMFHFLQKLVKGEFSHE